MLLRYRTGRTKRLIKEGRIPFIRLPDGEVRIDAAELEQLLRAPARKDNDD